MAAKCLSRTAAVAKGALMVFLQPKLATDARVDLNSILQGVNAKNFTEKKSTILGNLTTALKGKLAQDVDITELPDLIEALEEHEEEEGLDDADPMGASAAIPSAAHEFLKGKLSADDMKTYDRLSKDEVKPGVDPNSREKGEGTNFDEEEDKEAKDAEENKERLENLEKAQAKDRKAMDAKINEAIAGERTRQQAIRDAEKRFRPFLGELSMSFDSAEDVYRHGLKAMGVKTKLDGVPLPALEAILESQPKPGARPKEIPAMDASTVDSFQKRFKGAVQPKQL